MKKIDNLHEFCNKVELAREHASNLIDAIEEIKLLPFVSTSDKRAIERLIALSEAVNRRLRELKTTII